MAVARTIPTIPPRFVSPIWDALKPYSSVKIVEEHIGRRPVCIISSCQSETTSTRNTMLTKPNCLHPLCQEQEHGLPIANDKLRSTTGQETRQSTTYRR